MRALLDTHVLLWWLMDDDRLGDTARRLITDPRSELFLSAASSWEIAIKTAIGSLTLPDPPRVLIPKVMREQSISSLEITHAHALAVAGLPPHHRDPFDRLLAVQSDLEKLPLMTGDPVFEKYGVKTVW